MKQSGFVLVFCVFASLCVFSQDGILTTNAGSGNYGDGGDGSQAVSAQFSNVVSVVGLSNGSYLVVDNGSSRVRRVDTSGVITAFAGTGEPGYGGDEGAAVSAAMNNISDVVSDSLGNVYIADSGNRVIRKVDTNGIITTLGVVMDEIAFGYIRGLGVDSSDNIYVADQTNGQIYKIVQDGNLTVVAGDAAQKGTSSGDGGLALIAGLNEPNDVVVLSDGTFYILEFAAQKIRKVDSAGVITTLAGTGETGYFGDGGAATLATFYFDAEESNKIEYASGNLFIADSGNHVIRCIHLATNIIETVSGQGIPGYAGDNKWAIDGQHNLPYGVGCFPNGDLIVADSGNFRIRRVSTSFSAPSGTNSTVNIGDEAALNFKNVTSAGSVTIDVRDNNDPVAPGDFQVTGGRYFDINTDANFTGNIVLTLAYDDTNPADEIEDLNNKILHYDGTNWEDVTIEVRPAADQVDGRVNSLSPFALVKAKETIVFVPFRRGDANRDGVRDISDAVHILFSLFVTGFESTCADAQDVNDDGDINITDPIVLLNHLFKEGGDLPPPGPELAGYDLSEDPLSCISY